MFESPCGTHKQIDMPEKTGHGPDKAAAIPAGIFESRVVLKLAPPPRPITLIFAGFGTKLVLAIFILLPFYILKFI